MATITGNFPIPDLRGAAVKVALAVLLLVAASALCPAVSFAVISGTTLVTGKDTNSRAVYTTESFTPSPNRLYLAFVENTLPDKRATPTLTGNGLTWVPVTSVDWFGQLSTADDRLTVFRAMGTSPTTGSVTITFPLAQNNCLWTIVEFQGVDISGTNGSGAVLQSHVTKSDDASSLSITLDPLGYAGNASVGFFGTEASGTSAITAGTGYNNTTPLILGSGPNRSVMGEWKVPGSTTVNVTFGDHKKCVGVALELKAAIITTLETGIDTVSTTLPPGGEAAVADVFTLKTDHDIGTVTNVTVTLSEWSSQAIASLKITDDAGTVYGSVSPLTSDTPTVGISRNLTVTTIPTSYKVWVTPKSHQEMPAPKGSVYAVKAYVSNWTDGNLHEGSDNSGTPPTTVSIDNQSPENVTGAGFTSTLEKATLSWTNPVDMDFGGIVVLRRAGSPVADVPAEGGTYSVGSGIGSSVVACVVASPGGSCSDDGSVPGTEFQFNTRHYYKIFTRDTSGNYSSGGVDAGSFVPNRYQPDAMIWSEAEGAYLTPGVYQMPATSQLNSLRVFSGKTAQFKVRFKNNATGTDSIKVTGTGSGSNFAVHYWDNNSEERTDAVIAAAGYTITDLPVGDVREWTIDVTPAGGGAVPGGNSYSISVTATSVTDQTKVDQITATTTSSSPHLTLLKSADKGSCKPGEEIAYTTVATNGANLSDALDVIVTETIPDNTGFKIGGATFDPGSSGLSCDVTYFYGSNEHPAESGGCGAPAGYDYCVTQVKWIIHGRMVPGMSFTSYFVVRVK